MAEELREREKAIADLASVVGIEEARRVAELATEYARTTVELNSAVWARVMAATSAAALRGDPLPTTVDEAALVVLRERASGVLAELL